MGITMNLKPALKLSVEIAPAEAALRRADTVDELQDAWFEHCDDYNGARRAHLQRVYDEMLTGIKIRDGVRAEMLGLARPS